jgi:DNA-binding MarR family transcriptional regulator
LDSRILRDRPVTILTMYLRLTTREPNQLRVWSGLTGPQMHALLERLWQLAPDSGRGRPWALPFPDRVLLLALSYRTNLTMEQLAALFGISDSAVHRVVDRLAEQLAQLLGPPPADRRELWLVSPSTTTASRRSRRTTGAA